ncbi:MAG: peptide-methionine (S)-S-oxide reductase MsrA [Candidatus Nanohaloarchaea archaeon]|nr:peptide-methionine (S)-S-oxide reductase MsrA [Candidatus Nanohaloarchaea archaeon]
MATATATFAGGCFWCIEAVFKEVDGVVDTTAGYTGGDVADPDYDAVCSGRTGHAEAVQVEYDPGTVSYRDLVDVFFDAHDPTTRNREGPDVGSQYRSAVFYHSDEQRETVENTISELEERGLDIVTEVAPLEAFYPAAEKHQDYYEKHPDRLYCRAHIEPTVDAATV